MSFRNFTAKPSASILTYLKLEGILKYRGRRGGIKQDRQTINKIAVVNGRRPLTENNQQQANHSSLIRISCVNKTTARSINEFAVPKCLFTNICGLSKVKNRVRAEVALEADFRNHDIDVAVVSETHLAANIRIRLQIFKIISYSGEIEAGMTWTEGRMVVWLYM